jgi:hypothetical protein
VDNADPGFQAGDPIWEMVGWVRADGNADAEVQHLAAVTTPDVPWDPATDYQCGTAGNPGSRSATVLEPAWPGDPAPAWTFWEEMLGANEIYCRAGTFDTTAATVVDFDTFPYGPDRPLDTTVSDERLLTACVFNEATYGCDSVRTAGEARDVAATDTLGAVHVVWIDTRSGATEVFYKATKYWASSTNSTLATDCATPTEAFIDVSFDLAWDCDIRRYLVYYGTDPEGPYDNAAAPIVVYPGPPPPLTAVIGGLALGTTYYVAVVAEDEARNVSPFDFDPAQDNPGLWFEQSIMTPTPCFPKSLFQVEVLDWIIFNVSKPAGYFLVPPDPTGNHVDDPAPITPFTSGQGVPGLRNGVLLTFYNVDLLGKSLRVATNPAADRVIVTFVP